MLKRQINEMEKVARKERGYLHGRLQRVWYTQDYIYATDGYQVYRLYNDTDKVSKDAIPYPVESMDSFFIEANERSRDVEINAEEQGTFGHFHLCQIGHDFYDVKKIKQAYAILGKDVHGWEDKYLRFRGLHLISPAGEAFILPIRLYSAAELN